MNSLAQRISQLEKLRGNNEEPDLLKPVPSIRKTDLREQLSDKVKREAEDHIRKEMTKLEEHFRTEAVLLIELPGQLIKYCVEYVEVNAKKIAALLSTQCTSDFKNGLACSLLGNLLEVDESFLKHIISLVVEFKFPKYIEPLFEEPIKQQRKFLGIIKKK